MAPFFKKPLKGLIGLLLVTSLTSFGCGGGKGKDFSGTIKGIVTAASVISFKPLDNVFKKISAGIKGVPGAICILEGNDKSVETDSKGFFQFTNVDPGKYVLICKKMAFDGKVFIFLNFAEAHAGQTSDLGSIEITQAGNIQGKATVADLEDHAGIIVFIPGTPIHTSTDATGAYLIKDVPQGTYELHSLYFRQSLFHV